MTEHDLANLAQRVHDAERMNFGASSTRESRNRDWARIVGIAHHGHPVYNPTPDPRWHIKDGGGGRPQSDDVAVIVPGRMFADFIGGAGADGYTIRAGHLEGPLPPEQNVYPPPVPAGGGGVPAPPSAGATWTAAHAAVLAKLPDYAGTLMIAEQMAHSFPTDEWGQKSRGSGEVSKDTIGRKIGGRFMAYRVIPRGGAPAEYDLTNDSSQRFHPVRAENHLGGETPAPTPEPPVVPPVPWPPTDNVDSLSAILVDIRTSQHAIAAALLAQSQRLDAIEAQIAKVGALKFPTYEPKETS